MRLLEKLNLAKTDLVPYPDDVVRRSSSVKDFPSVSYRLYRTETGSQSWTGGNRFLKVPRGEKNRVFGYMTLE